MDLNGHLNLGTHNVAVAVDYNNANAGSGNSFNPHANVTGTGQINASPAIFQVITGNVAPAISRPSPWISATSASGSSSFNIYSVNNIVPSGGPARAPSRPTTPRDLAAISPTHASPETV